MNNRTGSASSPAAALEETASTKNQHPKVRGRIHTLLEKRVLVYDWDQKTMRVEIEKDVPRGDYQKVKLPSKRKRVTIFVDAETESKPTTRSRTPEGKGNIVLTRLYLDRLGKYHQLLRFIGQLPALYVLNAAPQSRSSSQVAAHGLGGMD